MNTIIILNGPPQCGKDTAKELIADTLGCPIFELRFAYPTKKGAHHLLGLNDKGSEEFFAHLKDIESDECFGKRMRDFYIHISEKGMKEFFGNDIFGKIWVRNYKTAMLNLADDLKQLPTVWIVADCGFSEELDPLVDEFIKTNTANILLIRIKRDGYTYEGDSRGDIDHPDIPSIEVINNGEEKEPYRLALIEALEKGLDIKFANVD